MPLDQIAFNGFGNGHEVEGLQLISLLYSSQDSFKGSFVQFVASFGAPDFKITMNRASIRKNFNYRYDTEIEQALLSSSQVNFGDDRHSRRGDIDLGLSFQGHALHERGHHF
jgi:hypothetical protein